ncbi:MULTISPECIES: NADH:flavin oxidoreductase/NADH oxidase [unclassified Microbacterium]|uniref:NADH:flavin oxidoreductase/NADH oxidase n=1 Tax=unclassified Microbacterium TaxID=2609290 RepID=UPI00214C1E3F|nr:MULTISPECIES: NADH:flavin oxidoreductase/NADH oxidase [unclassified Microbacterium]MCR2785274.1 NADH:flavin oxidoreductase/NADH oxidase [Microbacterium sp. zg.B96]WIM16803.1 NADH:flavin oxidoreductase/NADH oxidase [Microbacterium sp. zg-B96]
MSLLFTPLTIGGDTGGAVTARNRLWVAPMCQYSAVAGVPGEWHHVHLAQFASGGAGVVVAEATAVTAEGRISPEDTGLYNDTQRDAWAPIAAAIRSRGAVPAIQLAHAGRKASTWSPFAGRRGSVPLIEGGWTTVAPSPIAFEGFAAPEALDVAGIDRIVHAFAAAAVRAVAAGFEVLEVHAAHGYLLHEFLSPLSNQRDDAYGGSLENRARLLLRVCDAVREAAPGVPVIARFSATDWADGGWDVADTTTVAQWVESRGISLIDVSSGGLVAHQKIVAGPGYQVPFAARVHEAVTVPVSAVGEISDAAQAEAILAAGEADVIMAGREWLRDPHFALRAAAELGEDIGYWPPQYVRARRR